jgi:adenylate cyclase
VTSPDRSEHDGERKQVTVLFADVKGSMDLAEEQDPEQWRDIMQGFFSILADEVRRFEGTVDKFTGDGIMAVFGAPVAHEDHARRACYAALRMLDDIAGYAAELRRRHGLNFSTRIGINSGEVIAGAIGAGGDGAYTAVGHTVGLAQRMEALAEPGSAYLAEAAAEAVRGYVELKDLGEFEIKGASRPVRVFELAGVGAARSRLDLSRERGFSRFVGREREMATLEEALERALGGEGAVVGVVAEAGVGKSRLCHEFAERCRADGIPVFDAQGESHGQGIPYMPVLQMLRSYYGILDADPEQTAREKIAGRALLIDPTLADDLPLLFDFLGVPDPERPVPQLSPEARQRALEAMVCRLISAGERRELLAVVVEDLQWVDAASESMIGRLLDATEGTATIAIVNFRPEYERRWAGPPGYREITLHPLGLEDTRELLRDLAGEDSSLDGLAEHLHERTAGNPFFVEEIVRALVEEGALEGERGGYRLVRPLEQEAVPAGVQAVLAARIDRLGPEAKRLLQAASVAGKEVGERALGIVAGLDTPAQAEQPLRELTEAGFLYELELYPERVLAFRHPLTREVAYGSQLSEQRAAGHTATARALIELNPERHDELAALIAENLERGDDTLEAARWTARAAYWAGSSHPADALRLWRRVMELAAELPDGEETAALAVSSRLLQLQFAWRLGMDPDEEARLAAEAEQIAMRTGDAHSLAMLKMAAAGRPGIDQHVDTWLEAIVEVNRLADESGDLPLRVALRAAGSYAYLCAGDLDGFERELDRVVELTGGDREVGRGIVIGSPIAWAKTMKGLALRERGRLDEAEQLFDAGLEIAGEDGDPETASWTRSNLSLMLAMRGDAAAGVALARRNCELTERLGDVFSRSLALSNLGAAQILAEEFEPALHSIEESERIYREALGGGGEMAAWRAAMRAEALLGVGRAEEAAGLAEWAAGIARERGLHWSLPLALRALGRARAAAGIDGALDALDEAAAVAERMGALQSLQRIEEARDELGAGAR